MPDTNHSALLNPSVKILCHVCHFYGGNTFFKGKSSTQEPEIRKNVIEQCLQSLRQLGNIDIKICGIEGMSLYAPDLNFVHLRDNPTQIVYESIYRLMDYAADYDYFICIEDDILLPKETFGNILRFDAQSFANEILLPNRLETNEQGEKFCVDLYARSGWTHQKKKFEAHEIRVALNPHSGLLIASQEKLRYAMRQIDRNFRGLVLAAPMASAFAHFHSPFALYRSFNNLDFHYVVHLDHWLHSPSGYQHSATAPELPLKKESEKNTPLLRVKKMLVQYVVPPGFMQLYKRKKKYPNGSHLRSRLKF